MRHHLPCPLKIVCTMTEPTPTDDPRKDSLIEYPSAFPIKVMGHKTDGFVHAITQIAEHASTQALMLAPLNCGPAARATYTWA